MVAKIKVFLQVELRKPGAQGKKKGQGRELVGVGEMVR